MKRFLMTCMLLATFGWRYVYEFLPLVLIVLVLGFAILVIALNQFRS